MTRTVTGSGESVLVSNSTFGRLWLFAPSIKSGSNWKNSQHYHTNHLQERDVPATEFWVTIRALVLHFIFDLWLLISNLFFQQGLVLKVQVKFQLHVCAADQMLYLCSQQGIKACGLFSYCSSVFSNMFSFYTENELFSSKKIFMTGAKDRSRWKHEAGMYAYWTWVTQLLCAELMWKFDLKKIINTNIFSLDSSWGWWRVFTRFAFIDQKSSEKLNFLWWWTCFRFII